VSQVDQVTQNAAATANTIAHSAGSLQNQANLLNDAVQELKLLVDGAGNSSAGTASIATSADPTPKATKPQLNGQATRLARPATAKSPSAVPAASPAPAMAGGFGDIPMPAPAGAANGHAGFRDF
jgi:hypothetical protein